MEGIHSAQFIKGIIGTDPILTEEKPHIVFAGRSNVGKSSVINSLARKKDLVKSSSMPGKTREVNFFLINKKVYFVDLPGYGYAKVSPKEREKLKKLILWYLFCAGVRPKKVVLIIDVQAGLTTYDKEMLGLLKENGYDATIVVNKIDRLNQKEKSLALAKIGVLAEGCRIIAYSAKTHAGRNELLSDLFEERKEPVSGCVV